MVALPSTSLGEKTKILLAAEYLYENKTTVVPCYTLVGNTIRCTSINNTTLHSKQYIRFVILFGIDWGVSLTLLIAWWNCHHRKCLYDQLFVHYQRYHSVVKRTYINLKCTVHRGSIIEMDVFFFTTTDYQLPLPNYEPDTTMVKRSILLWLATIIQLTYCIISPSSSKYYDRL